MRRSWTIVGSAVGATMLVAVSLAGCATNAKSCIDPTGDRFFRAPETTASVCPPAAAPAAANSNPGVQPPPDARYLDQPMGQLPWDDVIVLLQPTEKVVPVGSEVVLVAGVGAADGYLRTNRRLEWSIAPGSVGQFVDVEKNTFVDLFLLDFNWPRLVNATTAVGSTGRDNIRLNRGTCTLDDDVLVLRGQGWITVTSSVEGTSHVAVVAPDVYCWDARRKSAAIHWVDAQWQFPPPAIRPAGARHVFATTVTRASNRAPREGWRVRYEIADGPAAGFAPNGAAAIEVPVDATGQARAEIFQKQPGHGVNTVRVEVIRPAGDGCGGEKLSVGCGTTTATWTASDIGVRITGPASINAGDTLTYRIEVSNPGDLAAQDVALTDAVPDGLSYLDANPPAENLGRRLVWRLGEIGARQQRQVEVRFRAERGGSVKNCCEVTAAGGLKASDCAATSSVAAPATAPVPLDVRLSGPDQAVVGSDVAFEIAVTNRGQTTATNAVLVDRFDPGLEHRAANQENTIKAYLNDIPPGRTQRINVTLRVTRPGRLCHTVEISGTNVRSAGDRACLTATAAAAPSAPSSAPDFPAVVPPSDRTPTAAAVSVKVGGPERIAVGETAMLTIDVKNTGATPLQGLKLVGRCDAALKPTDATGGCAVQSDRSLAWNFDLAAGQTMPFQIRCTGQTATARAEYRAEVVLPDGKRTEDRAYLEIGVQRQPATSGTTLGNHSAATPVVTSPGAVADSAHDDLAISIAGLSNPVAAGKALTYRIQVANKGVAPCRQVEVKVTAPDKMSVDRLGTVGPESSPTKLAVEGQTVRFGPFDELRPGKSLTCYVRVRTKQSGQYRLRVEVNAPSLVRPAVGESAPTDVF